MRLVLVMFLLMVLVVPGAVAQDDDTYVVRPGDVLDVIAASFDVSVLCLVEANDLANPNRLEIGQELVIPADCPPYDGLFTVSPLPEDDGQGGGTVPVTPDDVQTDIYEVQAGDRLSDIAAEYDAGLTCLVETNGLTNPDLIFIGQLIVIPQVCIFAGDDGAEPVANPGGVNRVCVGDRNPGRVNQLVDGRYTVQPGDSLDFIGCDLGLATECLATTNNLAAGGAVLAIGTPLVIDFTCGPWTGRDLE